MSRNYFEVAIEGNHDFIRGFVRGVIAGRGVAGEAFFGEEFEIDQERPFEMLARLVGLSEEHTVIVVEETLLDILREAIGGGRPAGGMKMIYTRPIRAAEFEFTFHTFSREVGGELDRILRDIPPDVHIEPPYAPEEKVDSEGRGVEAYAPLHEYELQAQGRVFGDCAGVCHCYERLRHYEVVDLTPVTLHHE
ncbi:MAG TPA: hypothetical protein PK175_06380 [Syntrophales bacterium]|jgi:hypothetical protein|nr:hypothetical protein [Syntrophales bacterium]HON23486.1 hypothetical protein [Syntrophales bacterium]HOU77848.1 hypothetical protein [Syntrophales bacterium]HPC31771.1 hypothetical protein [Syntrophales bacterium]HQG34478.1 hypothetical protein [Syntrophales bacterium]